MQNFPKDDNWSVMITLANNGVLVSLCDPLSNVVRIDVITENDFCDRYSSNSLLITVQDQFKFAAEQESQELIEPPAPNMGTEEDDGIPS